MGAGIRAKPLLSHLMALRLFAVERASLLGCLEEIFSLVVGHVAALCSGVALLNGCSSAVKLVRAGYPLLQSCAVACLTKDMCNTTVDVTFSVPVDPEWATVVLYQLPFAEVCQCVLCVSWHGDTLSHSQYTIKKAPGEGGCNL
jgi:hypothetical protein